MMRSALILTLASVATVASPSFAQTSVPTLSEQPAGAQISYNISADRGCLLGTPSATSVPLGVLIDVSGVNAGRLRSGIAPTPITLPNSWCNFNDNAITVTAEPIVATGVAIPPDGFSRLVNYRVSATGWRRSGAPVSVSTASLATDAPGSGRVSASGAEPVYRVTDIGLAIDQLVTAGPVVSGAGPLLVAAPSYQGLIIVSIGPALPVTSPGS
jgi:hypothetical protein